MSYSPGLFAEPRHASGRISRPVKFQKILQRLEVILLVPAGRARDQRPGQLAQEVEVSHADLDSDPCSSVLLLEVEVVNIVDRTLDGAPGKQGIRLEVRHLFHLLKSLAEEMGAGRIALTDTRRARHVE